MNYNGYTNYETWNVSLWLGSDESLYRDHQRFLRYYAPREIDEDLVEKFCRKIFPNGTPDMKSPCDMNNVNWEELADLWCEEAKEYHEDED